MDRENEVKRGRRNQGERDFAGEGETTERWGEIGEEN